MRLSLIAAAALLLAACSDTTGPTDPPAWPTAKDAAWRPQFQKTAQDGLGNGGGGSGGSGVCEYPDHFTGQCPVKFLQASAGFLGMLGTCSKGFNAFCAGAAVGNSGQWIDYGNTPDADGQTHTPGPHEYFGGPMYPIGGPGW